MRHLWYSSLLLLILLATACRHGRNANEHSPDAVEPDRARGGTERHEAPAHNAPDQDRIDSLKEEKLREKVPE